MQIKVQKHRQMRPLVRPTVDDKFYVSKVDNSGECKYLHKDGNWHYSTQNRDGKWNGYFDTVEDAEAALKLAGIGTGEYTIDAVAE